MTSLFSQVHLVEPELKKTNPLRDIKLKAVTIELSKGPIVYALQKFDFVINTSMLAQYRKLFHPAVQKTIQRT